MITRFSPCVKRMRLYKIEITLSSFLLLIKTIYLRIYGMSERVDIKFAISPHFTIVVYYIACKANFGGRGL